MRLFSKTSEHKRLMTSILTQSMASDPPHLVNIQVKNKQGVPLWYTIQPYPSSPEQELIGWEINRRLYMHFDWKDFLEVQINSQNYEKADEAEWTRRQLETNLRLNPDLGVRQSKGIFWRS